MKLISRVQFLLRTLLENLEKLYKKKLQLADVDITIIYILEI